eukprot:1600719-Amphidinium_carterae.1
MAVYYCYTRLRSREVMLMRAPHGLCKAPHQQAEQHSSPTVQAIASGAQPAPSCVVRHTQDAPCGSSNMPPSNRPAPSSKVAGMRPQGLFH